MESSRRGVQKAETLQFWNDFYTSAERADQEWIVQPNHALLDKLWEEGVDGRDGSCRILEIGCGTSTLSRDLYLYWQSKHGGGGDVPIYVLATDVSPVCIQQVRQRDANLLVQSPPQQANNNTKNTAAFGLDYQVLNLANPPPPEFMASFDIVLDKGCLDTFLFRSRHRGPQQHQTAQNSLVHTVVRHVHQCLRNHHGRYLILSPRRKIKVVRDFPGFVSVTRHDLRARGIVVGELDGSSRDKDEPVATFLHVCIVIQHSACDSSADDVVLQSPPQEEQQPHDTNPCPGCGVTFYNFRKGEGFEGRGSAFWFRRWKGHCQHCTSKETKISDNQTR
eukprot:scaffold8504_cov267-Amphora_coffeaeformis.AAC.1